MVNSVLVFCYLFGNTSYTVGHFRLRLMPRDVRWLARKQFLTVDVTASGHHVEVLSVDGPLGLCRHLQALRASVAAVPSIVHCVDVFA